MYSRGFGLDRFKKASTTEPFQVDEIKAGAASHVSRLQQNVPASQASLATGAGQHFQAGTGYPPVVSYLPSVSHQTQTPLTGQVVFERKSGGPAPASPAPASPAPAAAPANSHATTVGGGASTWQPPDWAVEPRSGLYHLEVSKEGQVVDKIPLDKKRTVFGRQQATCDFVLDHPSLSRQHAVVVHHKNGSVFVIDLGSVHGTFVSNERLLKDIPVEIEPGQSLRFAASSRVYILRKSAAPPPPVASTTPPPDTPLPPPPDPNDPEAILEYNTLMNRLGYPVTPSAKELEPDGKSSRKRKRSEGDVLPGISQKNKVRFRDENGGILVEVVGFSDGFDVATEPGPVGVREGGSLVGKFDSLVQTVLIPKVKTKSTASSMEAIASPGKSEASGQMSGGAHIIKAPERSGGVSSQLREYLGKSLSKSKGLYGSLGEASVSMKNEAWGKVDDGKEPQPSTQVEKRMDQAGGSETGVHAETDDTDMFGTKK